MHFLNNLVIPESGERLTLLYYLLAFVSTMMVTYVSIAAVGATLSLYFNRAGRKRGNALYHRFSRDLIDIAIPGKGAFAALGILPIVTVLLIYAQLLFDTNATVTNYIAASTILFIVGFGFLLAYRYSFRLEGFIESYRKLSDSQREEIDPASSIDIHSMEVSAHQTRRRAGIFGTVLLWLGSWTFLGGTVSALGGAAAEGGTNYAAVLFSWTTVLSFIHFITAALIIESAATLFFFFVWDGGIGIKDSNYESFVKRFAATTALVFLLAQPLLIFVDLATIPSTALSGLVFGLGGLTLLVVFILLHLFYTMLKQTKVRLGSYAFIGVVIMVSAWMAWDGVSFSQSNSAHYKLLASNYDTMLANLPTVAVQKVSGEKVYSTTCTSCHRFNTRLVGPPYNMVLPGYVGRLGALEDFITNPTQVLKGYPPMPKQGLTQEQVHAVAEYIMNTYLAEKKNGTAAYTQ
ncbi:MAG: cytochrome c [Bacteroidetes bacterium]|nr:cytochrome c [Bacteroidota bacterium]